MVKAVIAGSFLSFHSLHVILLNSTQVIQSPNATHGKRVSDALGKLCLHKNSKYQCYVPVTV